MLAGAGALVVLAACGGSAQGTGGDATVTVLAAASLTESFTEIGAAFEAANPGVRVVFSFGPSSALVSQLIQGAPADVVATASASTMKSAVDASVVDTPREFASNSLLIAVPASNPAGITGIAGLAAPGVLVAVCEPQVPCGAAAQQVIGASGLPIQPVTFEPDVKAVVTKVSLDEVDAGMVYATDVTAAGGQVIGIPLPVELDVSVSYAIAAVSVSPVPDRARAFVDFVGGARAQRILAEAGFGPPNG